MLLQNAQDFALEDYTSVDKATSPPPKLWIALPLNITSHPSTQSVSKKPCTRPPPLFDKALFCPNWVKKKKNFIQTE